MKYYLPAVKSMVGKEIYHIYDNDDNVIAKLEQVSNYWRICISIPGNWIYSSIYKDKSDAEARIYGDLNQAGYKQISEKLRILI